VNRRPLTLLDEALTKRRASVKRVIVYRPSQHKERFPGLPAARAPATAQVDEAIRHLAMRFDLSLILTGDKRYARQLADKFVIEFQKTVATEGVTQEAIRARIVETGPLIKKAAVVFVDELRRRLKTMRAPTR